MTTKELFTSSLHRIFAKDKTLDALPLEEILSSIPSIDSLSNLPAGTPVILRLDIDVAIKDGVVTDPERLIFCDKTLQYCMARGWKTIIIGHVGRDPSNTALPVAKYLENQTKTKVTFVSDWLDEKNYQIKDEALTAVHAAENGTFILFENTRKYLTETVLWKATEETFAYIAENLYTLSIDIREKLSKVLINDAIAASNFDFSSSVLPLAMEKVALGYFIAEEMKTHITGARESSLVVFSGLKIDKLDDLEAATKRGKVKVVIAAGSLAMALKKAKAQLEGSDFHLGKAELDEKNRAFIPAARIDQAKRMMQYFNENNIEVVLPVDFVLDNGEFSETIPVDKVQMDIGPKTSEIIASTFNKFCEDSKKSAAPYTLFYNGVFGKFEDEIFAGGTKRFIPLLKEATDKGVKTYVGGGEGRMALLKYGHLEEVTHAFTAGGTVLKSLSDKHIRYLKAMHLQSKSQ